MRETATIGRAARPPCEIIDDLQKYFASAPGRPALTNLRVAP